MKILKWSTGEIGHHWWLRLYEIPGLQDIQEFDVDTPFGKPSAPIIIGTLERRRVAFLARHGIGHHISPTEVNYRANIYALKWLGIERIIGISACGSLREDYTPGDLVVPNQLFDFTKNRRRSFFENGLVAHIGLADPFCKDLSSQVFEALSATNATVHDGGAFITIEGPRFSTRAESNVFRAWGMSIIGMTTSPEAALAREAEICYAVMAHVTDYDVWHLDEVPVSVEAVIEVMKQNTHIAQQAIANLARDFKMERKCDCDSALATALITDPKVVPSDTRQRLSLFIDKYLG
jgi:5'-methylthioadenosine phosphorylase